MQSQKEFIEQITPASKEFKATLENLLEGKNRDRADTYHAMERIEAIFQSHDFKRAAEATQLCQSLVGRLDLLNENEDSSIVLRFSLLIERMIEDERLGITPTDALFDYFVSKVMQAAFNQAGVSENQINYKLIRMLRNLYQRQLLNLLKKEQDIKLVFVALIDICQEIKVELPSAYQLEWNATVFYLTQLQHTTLVITPRIHRLLGMIDQRLNLIEQKKTISDVMPELILAIEQFPEGKNWVAKNIFAPDPDKEKNKFSQLPASLYQRFSNAIKDEILKLRESFELVAISQDINNIAVLEQNTKFLSDLKAILILMNKPKLANLAEKILHFVKQFRIRSNDQAFLIENANKLWILQEHLNSLWLVDDSKVPSIRQEFLDWISHIALTSVYTALAEQYLILYTQLKSLTTEVIDPANLKLIQQALNVEMVLNNGNSLASELYDYLHYGFNQPEACVEILFVLESCARRRAEWKEVSKPLIDKALNILEMYQKMPPPVVPEIQAPVEPELPPAVIEEKVEAVVVETPKATEKAPVVEKKEEDHVFIPPDVQPKSKKEPEPGHMPLEEKYKIPLNQVENPVSEASQKGNLPNETKVSVQHSMTEASSSASYHPNHPIDKKQLQNIMAKIDMVCSGWEAIGEDVICRRALHKAIGELKGLAVSAQINKAIILCDEWLLLLSEEPSKINLTHVNFINLAMQSVVDCLSEEQSAEQMEHHLQFINTHFKAPSRPENIVEKVVSGVEEHHSSDRSPEDLEIIEALMEEIQSLAEKTQMILSKGFAPKNDVVALQRIAHTLKGSANIVNASLPAVKAGQLEKQLENTLVLDRDQCLQHAEHFSFIFNELIKLSPHPVEWIQISVN